MLPISYCCRKCEALVHEGEPQFESLLCLKCHEEEEKEEESIG